MRLIVDIKQAIVLITDEDREEEAVTRLARVGYDNTLGYLKGGTKAWKESGREIDNVESITGGEFLVRMNKGEVSNILDVRKPTEFLSQHVKSAQNLPLDYINSNMNRLNKAKYILFALSQWVSFDDICLYFKIERIS